MQKALYIEDFIFKPQIDSNIRAHASCIIETPEGNLLAVWYQNGPQGDSYYYKSGDWDKTGDVHIRGAWRLKGADSWGETFIMADTFGVSDNNPTLAIDKQNRLWFFYVTLLAVPEKLWESSLLRYKVSSEYEALTPPRWDKEDILILHPEDFDEVIARETNKLRRSKSRRNKDYVEMANILIDKLKDPFNRGLGWMPRAHPSVLKDGTLMLPLANENFDIAAMAFTTDGGKSWKTSKMVPGLGVIQPSIVQHEDGRLVAYFRDASNCQRIKYSESFDNGISWFEVKTTDLPNPGSGVEALLLQSGNLLMVYNDKEKGRDRLAVSISTDGGKSWKWTRHIESEEGQSFCYPSVIQSKDGLIHVTYSYKHITIKHVCFNEAWVMKSV